MSSSQSPLSPVSVYGENCARSLAPQGHFRTHSVGLGAPPLPTVRGAAGPLIGLAKRETGRARSKEKSVGALRCSGPPRDGGRRIGASADLARPSGTLYSSAISPTAVPWRMVRRSSGWSSHGAASLFAAASCPARELPIKASAPTEIPSALRILWGPTCVSALARVTKATSPVGADALVRPPAQAATTAQAARSDCAAVGGSAVLRMRRAPCGQAERAEGGASGTLVTEIRGAPQRETGKEERFKCARVLQSKTHYAAGIRR